MSDTLDQRPGNGRRRVQEDTPHVVVPEADLSTMSADDGIMAIKRSNPHFSFAQAEEMYHNLVKVKPAEEPVLPKPVYEEEPAPVVTIAEPEPVVVEPVIQQPDPAPVADKPAPVVEKKAEEPYVPQAIEGSQIAADHEPEASPGSERTTS